MIPIRVETDTPIINWQAYQLWSTVDFSILLSTFVVRSDGVKNTDFATMDCRAVTGAITAREAVCAGVHIAGPQAGEELTPYAVSVTAMAGDSNVRPFLFVGESPAVITNDATGDNVAVCRFLAIGDVTGSDGSSLNTEMTVVIAENTADRALCFGVGMLAGVSAGLDAQGAARLSVRRLLGPQPQVLNMWKQG